ncbi:MAG TPA: hypothetical protein VGC67_08310 [Cellulomonas sp.]
MSRPTRRARTADRSTARTGRTAAGTRALHRALAVTTLVAVLPVLAACSGSSTDDGPGATTPATTPTEQSTPALTAGSSALDYPAVLDGLTLDGDAAAGIAWTEEPGLLYVITLGSSSCPLVAEPQAEAAASGSGVVVTFVPIPDDAVCTADLRPTTTVVGLPTDTSEDEDLVVELDGIGTATIPARSLVETSLIVPVVPEG